MMKWTCDLEVRRKNADNSSEEARVRATARSDVALRTAPVECESPSATVDSSPVELRLLSCDAHRPRCDDVKTRMFWDVRLSKLRGRSASQEILLVSLTPQTSVSKTTAG